MVWNFKLARLSTDVFLPFPFHSFFPEETTPSCTSDQRPLAAFIFICALDDLQREYRGFVNMLLLNQSYELSFY